MVCNFTPMPLNSSTKTKRPRPISNSYNEASSESSGSDNDESNEAGAGSAQSMLAPSSDELVADFGALAWAPWGARHYPGMIVSGWRCHLRPARPGWRWLLWLAEGKVSEVSHKSLLPLCSEKALTLLPSPSGGARLASGSLQQRGLARLLDELLARGVLANKVPFSQLRESLAGLDASGKALVSGESAGCRLSDWAERCLDGMRERHRRSCGVGKADSRPTPVRPSSEALATSASADDRDSDSDFKPQKPTDQNCRSHVSTNSSSATAAVALPASKTGRKKSTQKQAASSTANVNNNDDACTGEVAGSRPITDRLMRKYRPISCDQADCCLACSGPIDGKSADHPVFAGHLCKPCARRVNEARDAAVAGQTVGACSVCAMRCPTQTAVCTGCKRLYCQACLSLLVGPAAWALTAYAESDATDWLCCLCLSVPTGLLRPADSGQHQPTGSPPTRPLRVMALFDQRGLSLKLLHAAGLTVRTLLAASCCSSLLSSDACADCRVVNLGDADQLDDARLAAALPIDLLLAPSAPCANDVEFYEFHRCLSAVRRLSAGLNCRFYWLYRAEPCLDSSKDRVTRFLEREPVPACSECVWAELPSLSFIDNDTVVAKENSSVAKENSSVAKENSSVAMENSSLAKENYSVAKANSSVAKENSLVAKENSSVAMENSSLAKENYSVAKENLSVAKENYSAAKEKSHELFDDTELKLVELLHSMHSI